MKDVNTSLQKIEDFYLNQNIKGENLRNSLQNDEEYQKLLLEKKAIIKNKYGIDETEESNYVLPTEADYEILADIKFLEKKELSQEDVVVVKLIKTQLLDDWRSPLIQKLKKLKTKYS